MVLILLVLIMGCLDDKKLVKPVTNESNEVDVAVVDTLTFDDLFVINNQGIDSFYIHSKVIYDDEKYLNLENFLVYKKRQFVFDTLLVNFVNNSQYSFNYAEFSEDFVSGSDYKSFSSGSLKQVLIKGYNPFCNGTHCTSYYLFVIFYNKQEIKQVKLFFFDSKINPFEDFKLIQEKLKIKLKSKGTTLYEF